MKTLQRRLALIAAGGILGASAMSAGALADTPVPYTDPNAAGQITLCDQNGKPLTHGDVATTPFAWSAHSTFAAPKPYDGQGKSATLLAYQPRQGVDPGDWSGGPLSSSALYTDAAHPTAALTSADSGLDQALDNFPAVWDGLIQLRIYLNVNNEPGYTLKYAAENIQVSQDGKTWTALNPGSLPCSVGSGTSSEVANGVPAEVAAERARASAAASASALAGGGSATPRAGKPTTASPPTTPGTAGTQAASSPQPIQAAKASSLAGVGQLPSTGGASQSATPPSAAAAALSPAADSASGNRTIVILVVAAVALAAAGAIVAVLRRRASRTS